MKRIYILSLSLFLIWPAAVLAGKPGWTGRDRPPKTDVYEHKETMNAKHEYKKAETPPRNDALKGDQKPGRSKGPKRR